MERVIENTNRSPTACTYAQCLTRSRGLETQFDAPWRSVRILCRGRKGQPEAVCRVEGETPEGDIAAFMREHGIGNGPSERLEAASEWLEVPEGLEVSERVEAFKRLEVSERVA